MPYQVHILTHPEIHTTGHYLASAARRAGASVKVDTAGLLPLGLGRHDMLFYVDPGPLSFPLGLERLSALRVAYFIDVHQDLQSRLDLAPLFDLVFVAQRDYIDQFSSHGHMNVRWLPLACDSQIHWHPGLERVVDVGFIGKFGFKGTRRHSILSSVLPRFAHEGGGRFYSPTEMGRLYSQSKIVFNVSINGDVNMRLFEAMAAGALLVTDRIGNGLGELFVEGQHYIGYSEVDEAISRIEYFLRKDEERETIARAGQALALTKHSYDERWKSVQASAYDLMQRGDHASLRPSQQGVVQTYGKILESRRDPRGLWRMIRANGLKPDLVVHFVRSIGRAINAVLPLTPNAVRARLRSTKHRK